MVSNNRKEGFRGVLQLLALSASVFRFMLQWQMGFICPNGLDCNTTSSETVFVIFADSLSVPLWLLKRQDISVPAGALGMAEAGFRVLAALNKLSVVFSAAPAGQCCFSFGDSPTLRLSHTVHLQGGSGEGRRDSPSSAAAEHLQAATPLFLCPKTLLSLAWIQKVMSVNFHWCCFMSHLLLSSDQAAPC